MHVKLKINDLCLLKMNRYKKRPGVKWPMVTTAEIRPESCGS